MNARDTQSVRSLLELRGYRWADVMEDADVVLFNTCSVRQHAEERVWNRLAVLSKAKARRPGLVFGVLGCMAQEHGERFFKRIPALDFVCGPGNLDEVPDLIDGALRSVRRKAAIDRIDLNDGTVAGADYRGEGVRASVNITVGCDNRCTYCIVPTTRGRERSRASTDVIGEIRKLVDGGSMDITLLGQNVNSYGKGLREGLNFVKLLEKIDREAPPERLRFMTSHPKDAGPDLFKAMRDLRCVCEHLHLPVQSGSSRVLRRMKRGHTREEYLRITEDYRKILPGGSLTTDLIVGFCGETEDDFHETRKLVETVGFDAAFMFMYSPRPGTPAARLEDDVSNEVKNSRLQDLLALQKKMAAGIHNAMIGTETEVLFESVTSAPVPRAAGRTRGFKRVVVLEEGPLERTLGTVIIQRISNETLVGRLKA
ncbi:MAG: tRNA (N6-isopentenyl adenosine(37)-C2)-methylthiotransferase MiaB [Candidatus Omnitrophica bacterium]|nr:tRNA (N6-isopentenyl adenosine(37)-C2)-methylthiotransferase MiaB [Candidatus Omnitrophota bacterium]